MLRPLNVGDFTAWREVRTRCGEWLTRWEPSKIPGAPDPTVDRDAFGIRCAARQREQTLGTSYGFGVFYEGIFCGEINLNAVQRGPFQNAYVGYWIDERVAGLGLIPEAMVVMFRYAFETIGLHRLQAAVVPRNTSSRRVVEKLNMRNEGVAVRYLEINGVWEDHVRYAVTAEDWDEHASVLEEHLLSPR